LTTSKREMEVQLMKRNTTDVRGGVNARWYKTAVVIFLVLLFARGVATQNTATEVTDSLAIFVAHPWDPNTPPTGNPELSGADPAPLANVWTAIGPAPITNGQRPGGGPVSGRITGVAADPTDVNTIYVAAAGGGVWKTTDGGSTWNSLTDSMSTLSMGAIAIAPGNHSVVYAGTGEANNSATPTSDAACWCRPTAAPAGRSGMLAAPSIEKPSLRSQSTRPTRTSSMLRWRVEA
jgi:hypothetical protein